MKSPRGTFLKAVALLGILAGAWLAYGAYGHEDAATGVGRISVAPTAIDLGTIAQDGGPVSATVTVTNIGDGPLHIDRISTSCNCTTASMAPEDMAPGEARPLTITFDPAFHPDVEGEIVRVVYLQTSDPDLPEASVDVTGTVVTADGV